MRNNQWLIDYQIPLIVIARQPKFQRLWALIITQFTAYRILDVYHSLRAKYGVRNGNSGSTIGVFRSLLSSTHHQYDRTWNDLEWDLFCLDLRTIYGPFFVSFCWKQFLIEIETYNSRKTHLTYSCVSWHLCVHSCPDSLSWIHSTSTPLFTLFALFHYSSIMDSQANCGVNDLGTGNVSCDEQPLIDRKQNVPTLFTVNTSKSSRSILTCWKPIMPLLLVGGYLAVLSLNGVFHSHHLLELCHHPQLIHTL